MKTLMDLNKEELINIVYHMTRIATTIIRDESKLVNTTKGLEQSYRLATILSMYNIMEPLFTKDESLTIIGENIRSNFRRGINNPDVEKLFNLKCDCVGCTNDHIKMREHMNKLVTLTKNKEDKTNIN